MENNLEKDSSPKFIKSENVSEKDLEKDSAKISEKHNSFNLNKIPFDEGELHPDPEMHNFIVSMLKEMYPEFF